MLPSRCMCIGSELVRWDRSLGPAVRRPQFRLIGGGQDVPIELAWAFAELAETLRPFAGDDYLETFTETFWGGLHGLVTLMRNGRLRREEHGQRLALLVDGFCR